MLKALFQYTFLQNAFACSILISIACGIIGTVIILKRLVMLSGGIAHTAFGGVGIGYFLGIEPIIGALAFSVAAAFGIGAISRKSGQSDEIATGIFWSAGMALGIVFLSFTPGYLPDITSYLFGDILTVSSTDLVLSLVLDAFILLAVTAFFNLLKAYLFDQEFASLLKIKTQLLDKLIYLIIALTVVILIRAVGIVLALALLTAPPAIALKFSSDLKKVMLLSVAISLGFCFAGLWASYQFHIASGAAIALLAAFSFLVSNTAAGMRSFRLKRRD